MKDWVGNYNSIYKVIGASNHTNEEREKYDYYATEPKAMELLLNEEKFCQNVWECAVGGGHLAEVLIAHGHKVFCSDIIDRGYPGTEIIDFLKHKSKFYGDIITNPPYKYAKEFAEHALELVDEGKKVAMFLKLTFLEGKRRKDFFKKYPPKTIYVASGRLLCAKNAEFQKMRDGGGSAVAYAWYVWEKGYDGTPTIKWIN